jgi:anaerobic selenocysteine-containing dehydrogenase
MPEQETEARSFSRRKFIKGAAVLTATGALAACSSAGNTTSTTADASTQDEIYAGCCRGNCGGGCFLDIHVRDGQVTRTTARDMPDTQYNRICTKGLTHVGRMYGANRVLHPMKRTGNRGSNDFEQITWDEALQTIADKWQGYIQQYGPTSIMFFMGSGNYALCSGSCNNMGAYQRFINVLGCSYCSLDVDAAVGYGSRRATGGTALGNELTDRKNAKTQIIWGNNPCISLMHTMHFFMEAKENGTKYIVIDPAFNANTAKADWWLPIKPATDGALALSVLNVLFANGWVDEDTIRTKTNCPLLIKSDGKYLRMSELGVEPTTTTDAKTGATKTVDPPAVWDEDTNSPMAYSDATKPAYQNVAPINGITVQTVYENAMSYISQYPPETATNICGVSVDDIKELARTYHEDGPVTTEVMMGLNHYFNGQYSAWPVYLITLLTGNYGGAGKCIGNTEEYLPQYTYSNIKAACSPSDSKGNAAPGKANTLHTIMMGNIMETGKLPSGDPLVLKSAYIHCSNPGATMADHDYTTGWLDKFEFIVVADVCMTETAKHADIVLPSAHWFEQEDVGFLFSTHPYLLMQDKAVEPLGDSKSDFQIFGAILNQMGMGDFWNISEEDYISTILDSDYWRSVGCTLDNLKSQKATRIYPEGTKIAQIKAFGTETGRFQLYQETNTPAYNTGQKVDESTELGLYWETGRYVGEDRDYRKQYPYSLLSEHMRTHTHTQWWDCDYVKEFEREPVVRVNMDDAKALGINEGDTVKLSNAQGTVTMKATITAGIPPKMLASGRSWQIDDFIAGHFASLPSHDYNQVCANQCFNDVAVTIEKA